MFLHKLVLAKDAAKVDATFSRNPAYVQECQYPEAFEPILVRGRIVICVFSDGFYNGTSNINAIIETATTLGFIGFAFIANPVCGDFIAEPIPFSVPGIMIPKVVDAQVLDVRSGTSRCHQLQIEIMQSLCRLHCSIMSKTSKEIRKDL